jgi:hypothetical protein
MNKYYYRLPGSSYDTVVEAENQNKADEVFENNFNDLIGKKNNSKKS